MNGEKEKPRYTFFCEEPQCKGQHVTPNERCEYLAIAHGGCNLHGDYDIRNTSVVQNV